MMSTILIQHNNIINNNNNQFSVFNLSVVIFSTPPLLFRFFLLLHLTLLFLLSSSPLPSLPSSPPLHPPLPLLFFSSSSSSSSLSSLRWTVITVLFTTLHVFQDEVMHWLDFLFTQWWTRPCPIYTHCVLFVGSVSETKGFLGFIVWPLREKGTKPWDWGNTASWRADFEGYICLNVLCTFLFSLFWVYILGNDCFWSLLLHLSCFTDVP